jgi:hypothetical protein
MSNIRDLAKRTGTLMYCKRFSAILIISCLERQGSVVVGSEMQGYFDTPQGFWDWSTNIIQNVLKK